MITTLAESFGVEPVCRELGVCVSTYYARRLRERCPSARALEDERLVGEIDAVRQGYRRVYGARKTWRELLRRGEIVGRDRVARLMRQEGWHTASSDPDSPKATSSHLPRASRRGITEASPHRHSSHSSRSVTGRFAGASLSHPRPDLRSRYPPSLRRSVRRGASTDLSDVSLPTCLSWRHRVTT